MRAARRALARLLAAVRGHDAADAELREEMEAHLEMEVAELVRRGVPPAEARRRATMASGGMLQAAESVREGRGVPWIEGTIADVRYALRHFRRTPMATGTMVGVLALGLGVTIVLFTLLGSIATMPAPGIARDEALVRVRGVLRDRRIPDPIGRALSWPEVQAFAARTELFEAVAAYADEPVTVVAGGAEAAPFAARASYVAPSYFAVLGVRPAIGREPAGGADAERLAASPTAVIAHALWQRRFGGAADVVGRTVRVNDVPVEIVGVAPPRFAGPDGGVAVWLPLAAFPTVQGRSAAVFASADSAFLGAAARLRPGVGAARATTVLHGLAARAAGTLPDVGTVASADVVPMRASNGGVGGGRDLLVSSAVAAAFALLVLLVTGTNASALMVGLALARRRELGVRLALGARRGRLVRQLLTESVLLALAAAAIGLAVTAVAVRVLGARLEDVQLAVDWRVTLATLAVAAATGVLLGISPALHATRVSVGAVLKDASRAVASSRSRLQRALVVAQVALTQPLLVGLGVVVTTMATEVGRGAASRVGDRLVEVELDPWSGSTTMRERAARVAAAVATVGAMPGVAFAVPMQAGTNGAPLAVHPADRVPGIAYEPSLRGSLVAAPRGYFAAMEIPVVRGRDFAAREWAQATDDPMQPIVTDAVIVGSDLARRLWGAADPIGRRLETVAGDGGARHAMTVVGVVDAEAAGPSVVNGEVRVWVPYATMYSGVLARTAAPAAPMLDPMRRTVAEAARGMPIVRVETVQQRDARVRRGVVRAGAAVAAGGIVALVLAAIGLYATVSFVVGQRTREIGIRAALGAGRGTIVRAFFAQGLLLGALGVALGLPLGMVATRAIAGMLGVPVTSSPLLAAGIGALVLLVAATASYLPARRASAIDPLVALRAD